MVHAELRVPSYFDRGRRDLRDACERTADTDSRVGMLSELRITGDVLLIVLRLNVAPQ